MYCIHCGRELPEEAIFCAYCGKRAYEKDAVHDAGNDFAAVPTTESQEEEQEAGDDLSDDAACNQVLQKANTTSDLRTNRIALLLKRIPAVRTWAFIYSTSAIVALVLLFIVLRNGTFNSRVSDQDPVQVASSESTPSPTDFSEAVLEESGPGTPPVSTEAPAMPTPVPVVPTPSPYIPQHTVTISASPGGTVYPSGTESYKYGDRVRLWAVAQNDYTVEYITVNGKRVSGLEGFQKNYEFDVDGDKRIYVQFRRLLHTYEIVRADVTWLEAYDTAIQRGGHLATVNSREEMAQLTEMAAAQGVHVLLLGGTIDWHMLEASWVTGEAFDFVLWLNGEPNNDGGYEDTLALMNRKGEWGMCDVPDNAYLPYSGKNLFGYAIEWEN